MKYIGLVGREIKKMYYLDEKERVGVSPYSDGFLYVLEDGTRVYTMSTDIVAPKIVPQESPEEGIEMPEYAPWKYSFNKIQEKKGEGK